MPRRQRASAIDFLIQIAGNNTFPIALAAFVTAGIAALSPYLLVADSWMTLVSGREIAEHGIPHHESLTVLASGREWIDQQWLAQFLLYELDQLGGLRVLAIVHVLVIGGAVGSCMAAARLLGASARSAFLVMLPCMLVAPWSWQLRAQVIALPLFVWTLWLAADHVRRPSRRILVALPLLVLWANVHGSVLLGALVVSLAVVWTSVGHIRGAGATAKATGLALAPWLCALATPYGTDIVRYYHLLLVDPPFGDAIVEWKRTTPNVLTAAFYVVAAATVLIVLLRRSRLTSFEIVVLALLLVGAIDAVRGIVWFTLAVAALLPNAVDGLFRKPDVVRYARLNVLMSSLFAGAAMATLVVIAVKPTSWFESRWPEGVLTAVRSAGPEARVYPSDRHADWLLWKLPDLQGRVAYDVRFELLTKERFRDLVVFDEEHGADWMQVADGYDVIVVDETSVPSHTRDFLVETGARAAFRDEDADVTVIVRTTN